jgi:hypothetical protein
MTGLGLPPAEYAELLAALDQAVANGVVNGVSAIALGRVATYLRRHGAPVVVNGSAAGTTLDSPAPVVPPSLVDVATAAVRLGVSPRAIRKRCAAGHLIARKTGGVWLVSLEEEPHAV